VRQAGNLNYVTHTQGIIINKEIIKKENKKSALKKASAYNKHPVRNTDRPNNNNIQQRSHFISAAAAQLFSHLFAAAVLLSTFFKGGRGINLA
jgi:hypothetical protein